VAFVDEVEEREGSGKVQKVYYSVLVKAAENLDQVRYLFVGYNMLSCKKSTMDANLISSILKEIYRIKLPGPAKIGEGKPENQNHAIVFTRGEALQAIDMNQASAFMTILYAV